jgi:hypothetical protein
MSRRGRPAKHAKFLRLYFQAVAEKTPKKLSGEYAADGRMKLHVVKHLLFD